MHSRIHFSFSLFFFIFIHFCLVFLFLLFFEVLIFFISRILLCSIISTFNQILIRFLPLSLLLKTFLFSLLVSKTKETLDRWVNIIVKDALFDCSILDYLKQKVLEHGLSLVVGNGIAGCCSQQSCQIFKQIRPQKYCIEIFCHDFFRFFLWKNVIKHIDCSVLNFIII